MASGKSALGRRLAAALGYNFVDTDELLLRRTGQTLPEMFAIGGEAYFRDREHETIREAALLPRTVIATGGGCVMRAENYDLLHQNGQIVWLRRDLKALPVDGRPVSQRDGVAAIYEKRKPLYERFADLTVDNDGNPADTAEIILKQLTMKVFSDAP